MVLMVNLKVLENELGFLYPSRVEPQSIALSLEFRDRAFLLYK